MDMQVFVIATTQACGTSCSVVELLSPLAQGNGTVLMWTVFGVLLQTGGTLSMELAC